MSKYKVSTQFVGGGEIMETTISASSAEDAAAQVQDILFPLPYRVIGVKPDGDGQARDPAG